MVKAFFMVVVFSVVFSYNTAKNFKLMSILLYFFLLGTSPMIGGGYPYLQGFFMCDFLSWSLSVLNFFLLIMMIYLLPGMRPQNIGLKSGVIVLLMFILYGSFISGGYLWFYFFFEVALIPIFVLIMGWGYQVERLSASKAMFLYTVFASLPLLGILVYMYGALFSQDFFYWGVLGHPGFGGAESGGLKLFLILGFLVKLPMYGVHAWLPKAHVEAPVIGSMILAALLLKLGGYGMWRFMSMMGEEWESSLKMLQVFSLLGGLIASGICVSQTDSKIVIAYSSVAHMALIIGVFLAMSSLGALGGLLMLIAHGFTSTGLFYISNCSYLRFHSRSLLIGSGALIFSPIMSLGWSVLCLSNMAAPPSLNLVSEMSVIVSLVNTMAVLGVILGMMVFMAALYNLILYNGVNHGQNSKLNTMKADLCEMEVSFVMASAIYPCLLVLMISIMV